MLVSVRIGSRILYRFSQILIVCAFIPEKFSKSFILNTLLTLCIISILFNKNNHLIKQYLNMDDFIPTSNSICIYRYNNFKVIGLRCLKLFNHYHSRLISFVCTFEEVGCIQFQNYKPKLEPL